MLAKLLKTQHLKNYVLNTLAPRLHSALAMTASSLLDVKDDDHHHLHPRDQGREEQLNALWRLMEEVRVDAYLISFTDVHNTEYVKLEKNLVYQACNFTGLPGFALVTQIGGKKEAICIVSPLDWEKAPKELVHPWQCHKWQIGERLHDIIAKRVGNGQTIGLNPSMFSSELFKSLRDNLRTKSIEVRPFETNDLVEKVYNLSSESAFKFSKIFKYTKTTSPIEEKLRKVLDKMEEKGASILVLSQLCDIAYLTNLRGNDSSYSPLFYSYAIIERDATSRVKLFVNRDSFSDDLIEYLENPVAKFTIYDYDEFTQHWSKLTESKTDKFWIPKSCNFFISSKINEKDAITSISPVSVLKSIKSQKEIDLAKIAHHEEARAFFKFRVWFDKTVETEEVDELTVANKLTAVKDELQVPEEDRRHVGLSFETICSFGATAADIHHTPCPDVKYDKSKIVLMDFGSQYLYGTTDTTRTFHLGNPSDVERKHFTLVLKSFIAVSTSIFRSDKSLTIFLEGVARSVLNEHHLDFNHSLGHGVGTFLNVHEDPPSTRARSLEEEAIYLKKHMVFSNEPGCYITGSHGIRIENLVYTEKHDLPASDANATVECDEYLKLVDLTMIPIEQNLIDKALLTNKEIAYLNNMNANIRAEFAHLQNDPQDRDAYEWMLRSTEPIANQSKY